MQTIRLEKRFPELHGFVLLDPERLDALDEHGARGADLLTRFTASEEGDRVSREGIAVPVLGLEPDYYTVVLRVGTTHGASHTSHVRSDGWVLGTATGRLVLCGLGYLARWDPDDPKHSRIEVPPGWYTVTILDSIPNARRSDDERLLELVLQRSTTPPTSSPGAPTLRA